MKGIKPADLTAEDVAGVLTAAVHLAECWDALREVELRHEDVEIEVEDIGVLAGELGYPPGSSTPSNAAIIEMLEVT